MSMSREEAGRKGAEALNSNPEKKHEAAQKAADTRKRENPQAFKEMGSKGGSQSSSNRSKDKDDNER